MKNIVFLAGILILLVVGGYVLFDNSEKETVITHNGNTVNVIPGVQKLVIGVKDSNYYPNTITVKAGQPVSITLDSSVQGCLRSFTIKDLGVKGYSSSPSQTIDFTPTKKGTFRFACSMGMGTGTIIVE